jgi:alkylation response protein AidB-like acyl-CoA dehydrogenase
MVPKINELGINGFQIKDYGGAGFNNLESGAIYYELAKHDAAVATFVLVHNAIGNNVVEALGDDEQK